MTIKETDPNFIHAHEKAQKFIKEHPNVPVVDVPPVDCGDTTPECDRIRHQLGYSVCPKCAAPNVPAEITNRMLAGWGRYNYMECADKGSHDMRLAFIAGYKRALHDAVSHQLRPLCDYTNRPALDSSQICRCGTCQLFARIILAED